MKPLRSHDAYPPSRRRRLCGRCALAPFDRYRCVNALLDRCIQALALHLCPRGSRGPHRRVDGRLLVILSNMFAGCEVWQTYFLCLATPATLVNLFVTRDDGIHFSQLRLHLRDQNFPLPPHRRRLRWWWCKWRHIRCIWHVCDVTSLQRTVAYSAGSHSEVEG